jgi:hypothetical protein
LSDVAGRGKLGSDYGDARGYEICGDVPEAGICGDGADFVRRRMTRRLTRKRGSDDESGVAVWENEHVGLVRDLELVRGAREIWNGLWGLLVCRLRVRCPVHGGGVCRRDDNDGPRLCHGSGGRRGNDDDDRLDGIGRHFVYDIDHRLVVFYHRHRLVVF